MQNNSKNAKFIMRKCKNISKNKSLIVTLKRISIFMFWHKKLLLLSITTDRCLFQLIELGYLFISPSIFFSLFCFCHIFILLCYILAMSDPSLSVLFCSGFVCRSKSTLLTEIALLNFKETSPGANFNETSLIKHGPV